MMHGIYIRFHFSYDVENACKMGKTINIFERDSQYATGELRRGHFEVVYTGFPFEDLGRIERLLQKEFCELNIRFDAGIEFYDKKIITLVDSCLIKNGINYIQKIF